MVLTLPKPRMGLLVYLSKALEAIANRMAYGAQKYGMDGVQERSAEQYLDKAIRHTLKVDIHNDTKNGKLDVGTTQHAVAGAFNLMALVELYGTYKDSETTRAITNNTKTRVHSGHSVLSGSATNQFGGEGDKYDSSPNDVP